MHYVVVVVVVVVVMDKLVMLLVTKAIYCRWEMTECVYGAMVEWYWKEKPEVLGGKTY